MNKNINSYDTCDIFVIFKNTHTGRSHIISYAYLIKKVCQILLEHHVLP